MRAEFIVLSKKIIQYLPGNVGIDISGKITHHDKVYAFKYCEKRGYWPHAQPLSLISRKNTENRHPGRRKAKNECGAADLYEHIAHLTINDINQQLTVQHCIHVFSFK